MDVDEPRGAQGSSSSLQREQMQQRRKLQKQDALKRRQRNLMLDQQARERDLIYVWHKPLPDIEDGDDTESQILLQELTAHDLRQKGRAAVAGYLAAMKQPYLELQPNEGNPFGDISRILADALAGLHSKVKDEPAAGEISVPPAPAPSAAPPATVTPRPPVTQVAPVSQAPSVKQETQRTFITASPAAPVHHPLSPRPSSSPALSGRGSDYIQVAPIMRGSRAVATLPQHIDGFTVVSLGRFPEQREFFEQGVIFAPGYRVIRPFLSSSAAAGNVVAHTCEIVNRDGGPLFQITAEDTKRTHESYSIIDAWIAVGRPAFELRGYHCNESAEAALDFFGLSVPRIRRLLEGLAPPEINLEAVGVTRHHWHETPSIGDDPDFALRTVETSLVRVPATQAIETVVRPAVSPPARVEHAFPQQYPPQQPGSRRGSQQSDAMLSPAMSTGRRYSANAEELAKGYPTSYGSPKPGAGMLILNNHASSSPQMSRDASGHVSHGPSSRPSTGNAASRPSTGNRLSPQPQAQANPAPTR